MLEERRVGDIVVWSVRVRSQNLSNSVRHYRTTYVFTLNLNPHSFSGIVDRTSNRIKVELFFRSSVFTGGNEVAIADALRTQYRLFFCWGKEPKFRSGT